MRNRVHRFLAELYKDFSPRNFFIMAKCRYKDEQGNECSNDAKPGSVYCKHHIQSSDSGKTRERV